MSTTQVPQSSLGEELLITIIEQLPVQAVSALSQTNHHFARLCDWKHPRYRTELVAPIESLPYWRRIAFAEDCVKNFRGHELGRMTYVFLRLGMPTKWS